MKNVTNLGLCWGMTFGLVAVALGQQPSALGAPPSQPTVQGQDIWQPSSQAQQPGSNDAQQSAANQIGNFDQQRELPAPGASQDRSIAPGSYQPGQSAMNGGLQRGELGVWMVESGGPGVEIQRITRGSAAEQAGLRTGDIILQVNGRGAASPQGAAQLIRQISIGQSGTLTIWRDGDQQQLRITMQPAREVPREIARDASQEVGFGGSDAGKNGEWASRTVRLEQQINTLTQELHQLRQELAQLRAAGPVQQTSFSSEAAQGAPPQNPPQPSTAAPTTTIPASPPPGFGQPEEKPAAPATEPAKKSAPPAAEKPATPPAAEKPAATDPFGSDSAQKPAPKAEEKPKTGSDSKGGGDDLFK